MFKKSYFFILLIFVFLPMLARAQASSTYLKIFSGAGVLKSSFPVLPDKYQGGVDLAVGDLLGNGTKEIIVGAGGGNEPRVAVYDGQGDKVNDFLAFGKNFQGGVYVSAADLKGNGQEEIIAGPGYLGQPQVKIFADSQPRLAFNVLSKNDNHGVRVLGADLGGDGKAEIIIATGYNEPAKISVYGNDGHKIFDQRLDYFSGSGGVNLAAADLDQDGKNEIIAAGGYGNKPDVFVFSHDFEKILQFTADDPAYRGGINIAAGDVNGDGRPEIITARSFQDGRGNIRIFDSAGNFIKEFPAFPENFYAGIKLAVGDVDKDGRVEILAVPERIFTDVKSSDYKYITVDLSKQTLFMWQDGLILNDFLISSGKKIAPTPTGSFAIYNKRPKVRMSWYYGPGNPMNYDLPNVPWVSSFKGPFTIHGTYWHHNFGHPMSHGCVNMYTPDAKLIYDWAEIGTPVIIY